MVRRQRTIEPDPASHAAYSDFYSDYLDLYPALKAWRENRKCA